MKVLFITNNYPTANFPIFGIFVKEQLEALEKLGLDCDVFFINGREYGVKAYLNSIIGLRNKLKKSSYDIIHCHHAFSALIFLFTFYIGKSKRIVSYQNPPKYEGGFFVYRLISYFFDAVILKNNSNKNNFNEFYLPNGVNIKFFRPYPRSLSLKKLNLIPNKNYILFLDSYKRRSQKRVDRFDEVINILKGKNNPHNIVPLKLHNISRELIPHYMSSSSLHVITSDFEGSPNSVKECLACNIPVVSTPVGSVRDLIGDIKGCYVSESFEPKELAELVVKSLKNKNFSSREILINKELDSISVSEKLCKIYKTVLNA